MSKKDDVKDEEKKEKPTMAGQLRKARERYEATVSYSNRSSADNGDEVAKLLRSATPEAVMAAAEILCGFTKGELATKYEHLNKGQQRMNSGNRIRSLFKKGEADVTKIKKALAA